jgi:hypothetical protein
MSRGLVALIDGTKSQSCATVYLLTVLLFGVIDVRASMGNELDCRAARAGVEYLLSLDTAWRASSATQWSLLTVDQGHPAHV